MLTFLHTIPYRSRSSNNNNYNSNSSDRKNNNNNSSSSLILINSHNKHSNKMVHFYTSSSSDGDPNRNCPLSFSLDTLLLTLLLPILTASDSKRWSLCRYR